MLVLSRRLNEKILFPTINVAVQVVAIKSGVVRLGIDAPPDVTILREEVQERMTEWARPALAAGSDIHQLHQLLHNRLKVAKTGLTSLRNLLQNGVRQDAEDTLSRLEEDLQMLEERLNGEVHHGFARPAAPPAKARRALLVEDNPNERELLATFLRSSGLEVTTASDGADALDFLHSRDRPDVVLMDMGMPRCDGPTAVREIRRDPALAGIKIVAVTGHLPEEFDLGQGPTGIDYWFHKPINPTELVRYVTDELDAPSPRR